MSEIIVLITGANTGLGYETVKALSTSSAKYKILLGGRSLDRAKAAADELRPNFTAGSSVEPVQVDIEDDESIAGIVRTITDKYGRLDVLVNNAGMLLPNAILIRTY